ncbi:hypothetical protein SALCHL_002322 [Streptomyces albus subsp. chlorinus]|uniref:hypothetical protein n=1 Tax=Streptomyces albus TaxID=1888 RepID=UPI003D130F74
MEVRPCKDCTWYRAQIEGAAKYPRVRADLEALFGAHLRRAHSDAERAARRRA